MKADEGYEKVENIVCDVKSIQNIPKGVSDFWIKVMQNHQIGGTLNDKDKTILAYLQNVKLELHDESKSKWGFDLTFEFEPNQYFKQTELKKSLFMKAKGVVTKMESTVIEWNDNCDPTKKKVKKKKKGKKVTVEEKQDSFFNFFTDTADPKEEGQEEDDMGFGDPQDALQDEHCEIGDWFKDDMIPLALEYYLGVIEAEQDEDDEDFGDDDDSDGDDKPKGKKGKKGGAGPDPKDCK